MIFVTVGTSSWDFTRLIKKMDYLAGEIDEEVIMQIGPNKYKPTIAEFFRITTDEEIERLFENARIIVSHAGVGSVMRALRHNKPIIVIPRAEKYGEHFDDHQIEMAAALEKDGIVKVVWDICEIKKALKDSDLYPTTRRDKKLVLALREYINGLDRK